MSGWREATTAALYGPRGFYTAGPGPAAHFRTSAHASPAFAGALLRLLRRVDDLLGNPDPIDVVDVGAGRGELLAALRALLALPGTAAPPDPAATAPQPAPPAARPAPLTEPWPELGGTATGGPWPTVPWRDRRRGGGRPLADRVRLAAVEVGPGADVPGVRWTGTVPDHIVGLLVATEWLDVVPLDVAETDDAGVPRLVRVDPATGAETPGPALDPADAFWLARWWPIGGEPGRRAELGWPRDTAWADAVAAVARGAALAVDYGHVRAARPPLGTLTGYRDGRQVPPVPDGGCDVTAHVATDAAAAAAGAPYLLTTQRDALRALGVDGRRPPLGRSRTDPAGYVRALAAAGEAAELTDPAGLGGHHWLLHGVGTDPAALLGAALPSPG